MAKPHQVKSTLAMLAVGTLLVAGGCSDGTTLDAQPGGVTTFNESGRLLQAPVYDAIVCADLNANNACDPGEPTTTSGADGRYTLPAFEGANTLEYTVLSRGGFTLDGDGIEVPGQDMAALPGATVMSMLTTMEAYTPKADRPALVAQLNALAGGVDYRTLDFVDTEVQPGLMLAVKAVEAVIATFNQVGASSAQDQQQVLKDLGTTIANAPAPLTPATVRTALPTLVSTAATTTVTALTAQPNANLVVSDPAAFSTAMGTLTTAVATAIPTVPVKETPSLIQTVTANTAAPTQTLTAQVTLVRSLALDQVTLTTNSIPQTWTAAGLPTTLTLSTLPSSLTATVKGTNSGAETTYSDIVLTLTISDNTPGRNGRNIVLSIGGLSAKIANGGALTLTKGTQALVVTGKTSTGVVVTANVADTSWGAVVGDQVTFNLDALNTLLGGRDLNTLARSGKYSISAQLSGPSNPPFVPMTRVIDLVLN